MKFYEPRFGTGKTAHAYLIEVKLREMAQLFNSMDPSPFVDKDLDGDAEEFILGWAQEYPLDAPVRLRIHLEQWPAEDPTPVIREAVHNYFAARANLIQLEFRRLMKQGRTSLLIGLAFLTVCLLASKILLRYEARTWIDILQQSLTIVGWVAMWRPIQIYFYDWWPLRRRGRIYAKLSRMPIEVTPRKKS